MPHATVSLSLTRRANRQHHLSAPLVSGNPSAPTFILLVLTSLVFIHESAARSGRKRSVASPSSSAPDASLVSAVKIRFKVGMGSVEAVNKILEEANKRIQATGTGGLFGALRGRLIDSNKNIVMATLTTIGNVASTMGPAEEKASKDKSSDVRKAAEACINEIVRVSGHQTIEKIVKDIHGPALALVLEKLKPSGGLQESFESAKAVSVGASKGVQKAGKSTANGVPKHGNKAASLGARSEPISVQDIALQSQALLNVKDSNKEDRERMVIRNFKFEDPRIEQIQDLESDMIRYFRVDLSRRLLSADFKKQVDGLEKLCVGLVV